MCHDALVDDGSIAELRRLQLRAYAPDGDIQGDESALRRFEELEHAPPGRGAHPRDGCGRRRAPLSTLRPTVTKTPSLPRNPLLLSRSHRQAVMVAGGGRSCGLRPLIVVAAVVGGTALSVAPRAPLAAGAHYVATLAEDPDFSGRVPRRSGGDATGSATIWA